MGVDFTGRRFIGFKSEEDLKKLPEEIQELLKEDTYIYGADNEEFDDFHVFTDRWGDGGFIAAGWTFQDIGFAVTEEEAPPIEKIEILKKYGIDAKVYIFVEQW